jgi:hypothetical protein
VKVHSIRAKVALAAGALSSLIVLLFAVLSAWRFYHEQLDVFDKQISVNQLTEAGRKFRSWQWLTLWLYRLSPP